MIHAHTIIEKPERDAKPHVHAEYHRLNIQQLELLKLSRHWWSYPASVRDSVDANIGLHKRALARFKKVHLAPQHHKCVASEITAAA